MKLLVRGGETRSDEISAGCFVSFGNMAADRARTMIVMRAASKTPTNHLAPETIDSEGSQAHEQFLRDWVLDVLHAGGCLDWMKEHFSTSSARSLVSVGLG